MMVERAISGVLYLVAVLAMAVTACICLIGGIVLALDISGVVGYLVRGAMLLSLIIGIAWAGR
jgi:hypothetical protein